MEEQEQPIRIIRKSDGENINVYFETPEPVRPICGDVELINPEHPPAYLRRDIWDEKGEAVTTTAGFYDPDKWAPLRRLASFDKERDSLEERDRARREAMGAFAPVYDYNAMPDFSCQGIATSPEWYHAHALNIKIDFANTISIAERTAEAVATYFALSELFRMIDTLAATINDLFDTAASVLGELCDMVGEYVSTEAARAENRHDGARRPPVPQLIPARTLHELYGQGVDHGGPGLPRLTLIRVTDDGLRRAETGKLRKGGNGNEEIQRLRSGGA